MGKTTLARQAMKAFGENSTYVTADNPAPATTVGLNNSGNSPVSDATKPELGSWCWTKYKKYPGGPR